MYEWGKVKKVLGNKIGITSHYNQGRGAIEVQQKKISDLVHQKSPNTKELFPSQNITSPDKKPLEFCIQLNDQLVVAF